MSLDLGCMNSMRLLLIRATNDQNTDAKQYVDNFENSLKQIHGNDVIIIRLKPALTVTNAALQLEEPYYRFVDAFESIYHMLSRTRNDKCQLENINEKNFVVLLIADGDDINLDSTINYSRQILSCHNTIYTIPIDRNVDICQLSKIATSPGTSFGYVGVDLLTDLSLPLVNIIQREHMVIKQNQQNFTLCNNVQRVVIHAGKTSNIPLIIQIKVSVPTNLYFGHFKYPSASRYEYKFSAIKSKPLTLLIQAIDDVYVTVSSKQISSTTPSWIDILNFKSCPPFHYGDNCRKMCYVSGYISHIVPCLDSSKSMYQSRNENTKSHRIYSDHSFVSSPTSFNQPARYSSHHENREIAKMLHPTGRQFPKTSNNRQNVVNQAEENKIVDDGLSHHTNRKHRFSATQSYIKSTIQSPTNSSVVDQSLRRFQSVSKTNRNNALVETNTVDDRHYLNHQIDDEYNNYYIEKPSNDKIKIVDFNTFADNTIIDDVDIVFNSIQASSTEQHLQPVVPSKNKSVFYNRLGSRPPVDYSNHQNASSCPYGTWNIPSCTGRCNCDNKISCDVITGRCPGKCLKGWMSSNLDLNRCDLPECNYKIENADENVELEYMLDPHFCNVFYCCGLNGTSNAIMLTCPKNMMFDRDGRCVKGVDANSSTTESCLQKDIPSKDDFECPQSLKSIKRQHFNARISMLMSHGLLPRHNESMASWLKSNGYMMSVHDPNHCDIYHQCIYDDNQNLIYSNYCSISWLSTLYSLSLSDNKLRFTQGIVKLNA
ncbi:hypothetical protein GJ496_006240 [Pomphorhynchus laevis]|nr:hypothetical protein GJ496_006240 [Pomphorhynchus laevis]